MPENTIDKRLNEMKSDYKSFGLPLRMWGTVERYLSHGIPPGHFMSSLLKNDLKETVARADDQNQLLIRDYVRFFYNCVPGGAWGSPENYDAWLERGGMSGGAQ